MIRFIKNSIKIAKKFDIKLVVYGENQAEYGNSIKENKSHFMNEKFYTVSERFNFENISIGGRKIKNILKEFSEN